MLRTDMSNWRAVITGEQNPEGDVELECEWGKENQRNILVNNTQVMVSREYYMKFISDRWILPNTTVHNMTILWEEVPQWLSTVGRTYLKYMPMVKYWFVKTATPWEVTLEPKKNWIENSYQMCMKTKTNDTVDFFIVMQDQELKVTDIPLPVNTTFLKKPLPTIVRSWLKPNITLIPKPTVCNITSKGLFTTFDAVRFNYTMPGTCPHVVARDCSTDERFTVLLQNVTLREEYDTVKTGLKSIVYVLKTKVELETKLESDLTTKKLEIKVNGQKVLENWKYIPKPEIEIEDTNTTIKRNATHITLLSGQGLTVIMSADELLVNVTHRHWNTTCGLCGNNDGEKTSEFRTPWSKQPTHVTNATKFGLSWLVQGDDCLDQGCNLKKYVSLPINLITDEPILIGTKKAACFSVEPVFYCPKECEPIPRVDVFPGSRYEAEKIAVEVGFSCLRTSDPLVQYNKMEDMVYNTKTVDIVKEIEVPHKCHCQNTCLTESKTKW
ncbi:vitellogenin-like [Amphiura filiformis]|uniref:vitellogenin-like n=1 Tax=Amphiura filiformis TaxID=82378 RepID=UPI003B21558A